MPVAIDIDHVARLARLALTDEEKTRLKVQLAAILDHAAKVGEVATDDVPPTAYAVARTNVWRDDVVEPSLPRETALQNAPVERDGRFEVPKIAETRS
jgi:aspartyl-tRNA(Asn)/glutamyl-tRNA(Gln) amidotransferase subunit C